MDDLVNERREYDPGFQIGVNTFAQNGIPTANSTWCDPEEPNFSGASWHSSLYAVAFLLIAALIFGLPLIY